MLMFDFLISKIQIISKISHGDVMYSMGTIVKNTVLGGFPGGTVVKNPPANAGDTGSSPGPGKSHRLWSN